MHTCFIDPAIVRNTGGRLLLETFTFDLMPSLVLKPSPFRPIFRAAQIEIQRVQWLGFSQRRIATQAICGWVHYCVAETIVPATCHFAFSKLHRTTYAKLACRNDQ
jgi:hypothetical protein